MKRCGQCGARLLIAGAKAEGQSFCSPDCRDEWLVRGAMRRLEPVNAEHEIWHAFTGPCPWCGGVGPNDAYTSYLAIGVLFEFSAGPYTRISCRRCARIEYIRSIVICALFGWWSLTALVTPTFIRRNREALKALEAEPADPATPSERLAAHVRRSMAERSIR